MKCGLFFILGLVSLNIFSIESSALNKSEVKVVRKSKSVVGEFEGILKASKPINFKASDCQFTFEKGKDEHPRTDMVYQFERFMVSFTGVDHAGQNSFDSVSYSHSEYPEQFKSYDYSKSFGPVKVIDITKDEVKGYPELVFKREGEAAVFTFTHTDIYQNAVNSKFYKKDEKRNIKTVFSFKKFTDLEIVLDFIEVSGQKFVKGKLESQYVNVSCKDFIQEK